METKKRITIFIHGTYHAHLLIPSFFKRMYQFVYHPVGLFHSSVMLQNYVFARTLTSLTSLNPKEFPAEHAFLYVWNGKLCPLHRHAAAHDLHLELKKLKQSYPEWELTLITHSHGANVALNLAHHATPEDYVVDRLIVLASPVQHVTRDLIDSSLFTQIIALYSARDILQIIDPQGAMHLFTRFTSLLTKKPIVAVPFFSERIFTSKKVVHILITSNGWGLLHLEFILPPFLQRMTDLIKLADSLPQGTHTTFDIVKNKNKILY